jgi:hypothetical protein
VYLYYTNYPDDWRFQKIFVRLSRFSFQRAWQPNFHPGCYSLVSLFALNDGSSSTIFWRVLDSLHLSLTIYTVYHYVVQSFGSLTAVLLVHWYGNINSWLLPPC